MKKSDPLKKKQKNTQQTLSIAPGGGGGGVMGAIMPLLRILGLELCEQLPVVRFLARKMVQTVSRLNPCGLSMLVVWYESTSSISR